MPPDLQTGFARNTVVVGPWGTGKTHLLRELELEYEGSAIRVSLPELFDASGSGSPAAAPQFVAAPERVDVAKAMLFAGIIGEATQNASMRQIALQVCHETFAEQAPEEALSQLRLGETSELDVANFDLLANLKKLREELSLDRMLLLFDQGERLRLEAATAIETLLSKNSPAITVVACQPGNLYLCDCGVAESQDYDIRTTVYDIGRDGQRDQFMELLRRRDSRLDDLPNDIQSAVVALSFGIPRVGGALLNKAITSQDTRLLIDEAIKRATTEIPAPVSKSNFCKGVVRAAEVPKTFNHTDDRVRLGMPDPSAFPRLNDTWTTVNMLLRFGLVMPTDSVDMRPFSAPAECWVHPGLIYRGLELIENEVGTLE